MEQVDVTIVGGGPTGLFVALLLQPLGISVRVLDEKPCSLELGRADALNARTQQYFEVAGILDELLPDGLKCNTSSTFKAGDFKSRQNAWWVGIEHAFHKNFLMIGQPVVEQVMRTRLGDAVSYNEHVISITEDEDSVTVMTSSGRKVRSKYAVGADGARSFVRNTLGISFTGTKPEMTWAVLDTFLDTDFPVCPEIITFELDGESRVAWIPRERGMSRFYVLLKGEITQQLAEESIKEHLAPYRVEFTKTEWFSTFHVKERLAGTFISKEGHGKIILAGDAAHVHSVNGGQGLNTGVSDAFALAWRLSALARPSNLSTEARDDILRSYDIERRSTAAQVIGVAAALVRDTIHTAKKYVSTIERNAGFITGMGVNYSEFATPLIQGTELGIWKPGYRCPDVVIIDSSGKTSRLYENVSYGDFVVLVIGRRLPAISVSAPVYTILPSGITDGHMGCHQNRDGDKDFTADWVKDSAIVIVRPDITRSGVAQTLRLDLLMLGFIVFIEIHCGEKCRDTTDDNPLVESSFSVDDASPKPVPNGGLIAWLQVAGSFCLYFCTWGLIASFGSFQTIYERDQLSSHTPFQISIIGSLQTFLMVFSGFIVGPIYDSGYFRHLLAVGSTFIVVGTVLQSLSQNVLLPIMIRELHAQTSLPWATRAMALLLLVLLAFSNLVLRSGPNSSGPSQRRQLLDTTAFTDWPYILFVAGCFSVFLGMYTPFVYVQSYALDNNIASSDLAGNLLAILNSSSIFGRILPAFLAQSLGPMNTIVSAAVLLATTSLCLISATTTPRLLVTVISQGFFTGSFFALQPTIFVRLTSDPRRIGTRFGMAFSVMSVALLFGPPVGGALRRSMGYTAAWVWAGLTIFIGGILILCSRLLKDKKSLIV
ncbi:FAD binding domain-containing protein [Fusarium sp. MPI-SDFR-AT-0072]|nr:FAD binding domain-containing protein [Fusarium sp. MPI-SDFR-AT-0072]